MNVAPYPDCVPRFVHEYKALIENLGTELNDESLIASLMTDSKWTERGSMTLVLLARRYGTSVLANALALAEALDIEDGEAGL